MLISSSLHARLLGSRPIDLEIPDAIYSQRDILPYDESYPKWNPAELPCSLHPTNAMALAMDAVTQAIPEVKRWRAHGLSLDTDPRDPTFWVYNVELRPSFDGKELKDMITIVVGINGYVPAIEKMTLPEWDKRIEEMKDELRMHLIHVQFDAIKNNRPLLPMATSPELKIMLDEAGISIPERVTPPVR